MRTAAEDLWDALVEWADEQIGSVDDLGHYAYITVDDVMISDMTEQFGIDRDECPRPGHYIIHSDSLGFVRPWSDWPMTMAEALAVWDRIVKAYEQFDEQGDDPTTRPYN